MSTRCRSPFATGASFRSVARDRWRGDDHLSLVARMRRDQVRRLEDAGITTVEAARPGAPTSAARLRWRPNLRGASRPGRDAGRRAHERSTPGRCSHPSRRAGSSCCLRRARAISSSTSRATRSGSPAADSSTSGGSSMSAPRSVRSGHTTGRRSGGRSRA